MRGKNSKSKLVLTRLTHAPIYWRPACSSVCPRDRSDEHATDAARQAPGKRNPAGPIPYPHRRSCQTPSTHNTQQTTNTQPNPTAPVAHDLVTWDCSLTVLFLQSVRNCYNDLEMLAARPRHNSIVHRCPNINTYVKLQR